MDIAYPTRFQFIDACEFAIRQHRAELQAGGLVHVGLPEGGYDGRVAVVIDPADRVVFGADWKRADPTRFPSRVRAAAVALLKCRCEGRYEVSHSAGSLTIQAV